MPSIANTEINEKWNWDSTTLFHCPKDIETVDNHIRLLLVIDKTNIANDYYFSNVAAEVDTGTVVKQCIVLKRQLSAADVNLFQAKKFQHQEQSVT